MSEVSKMPGHLIRRLHQVSTHVFMQHMREAGHDLTPVQFAALEALRDNPGTDQAGLAQAVAKDRATIGAVVDRLEQKGLIARTVSRSDKRARVLSLTADGEKTVSQVLPVVRKLQQEILPGLSTEEYDTFVALAAKAAKAAEDIAGY